MNITNKTEYQVEDLFRNSVSDFPVDGLVVQIIYCPANSKRFASGTYYRRCKGFENGGLIKVRINKANKYPLDVRFKTSNYERRTDRRGNVTVYQKLQTVKVYDPESLAVAIFLHEFSHYLDHLQGLNGKYKQTKADKFATAGLEKLGLI